MTWQSREKNERQRHSNCLLQKKIFLAENNDLHPPVQFLPSQLFSCTQRLAVLALMAGAHLGRTRWVMVCDNEAPGEKWVLQNFQSFKLELSCIISIPENDHYSTGVQRPLPVGENVSLMSIEYWFSSDLQL